MKQELTHISWLQQQTDWIGDSLCTACIMYNNAYTRLEWGLSMYNV